MFLPLGYCKTSIISLNPVPDMQCTFLVEVYDELTICSDIAAAIARLVLAMFILNSVDITWDYQPGLMWSTIEPSVGIMCCCLPLIRVVVIAVIPESLRTSSSRSSGGNSKMNNASWPRTATYNDIHGSRGTRNTASSSNIAIQDDDEVPMGTVYQSKIKVQQEFRVDEERAESPARGV